MLAIIALLAVVDTAAAAPLAAEEAAAVDTARVRLVPDTTADTTRRPAVRVSPWGARRLAIHRWTAYAIPPLFAYQYVIGDRLWDGIHSTTPAPGWVRPAHRAGAATIATAFAINGVTGVWNWWDARHVPEGRVARTLHGASMLTAAAGFSYAGIRLAEDARTSSDSRRQHRRTAIGSMALTLASGTAMWIVNR